MRIGDVKPYGKNPRRNATAIEKVVGSLREFGWQQPIVVDKKNVILAGHTRHAAALELGHEWVPVAVAENLTAKQARAYRLADNRTGQEADWDLDLLRFEIEALDLGSFELPNLGFGDAELTHILNFDKDPTDVSKEWEGMPEFTHGDLTAHRTLIIHFADENAVARFAKLIEQNISEKTRSTWYPEAKQESGMDREYTDGDAA